MARDLPRLVSPSAPIAQIPRLLFPHPSRRLTRCPGAQRAQPDTCWLMALVTDKTRGPGAIVLVDRNLVYHYITSHHSTVRPTCPFPPPRLPIALSSLEEE